MIASSSNRWGSSSGNPPRRRSPRSSNGLSARAAGVPSSNNLEGSTRHQLSPPMQSSSLLSRNSSSWPARATCQALRRPRPACPMETPNSRSLRIMISDLNHCRQLRSSPEMLCWEVTYSFAIMTPCRRTLNASSLDYHNVTAILCALFNQGFPFFCTIILLTSSMGSLRLQASEVRT